MAIFAPTLAVLAAATLFGTTGTALAKGPDTMGAFSAGTLRLLIGGTGLCVIAGRILVRDLRAFAARQTLLMVGGGLAVASYQIGFFWATTSTGVALATVVTIGSSPLIARIIASGRGRPSPDRWWAISASVLIAGLVLLVAGSSSSSGSVEFDILGVMSAAVAGASYAVYTEVGAEMIVRGWHPTSAMAAMFLAAGLVTSPLLVVNDLTWLASARGLVVISYLSLVTLSFAYVWFGWGLKRLPPTTVVMLTMFEPVIASVLAITVLDESLPAVSWVGACIVILGLLIVGLRSRPTSTATVNA